MVQSVIFDMDGTLFQTDKILALSLHDTFEHLRGQNQWDGETPLQQYREIMGVPLQRVWETLMPEHTNEIRDYTNAYFLKRLLVNIKSGKGALYPYVEEVFHYLKENDISIYIASNGLVDYLNAIVDYYKLDRWVTETFSIEQIESLDKGELVRTIITKYGSMHGAVVGDRLSDINAAKDNGLFAVGCRFDFAREEELAQADEVIDELMDLKSILPKLKVVNRL